MSPNLQSSNFTFPLHVYLLAKLQSSEKGSTCDTVLASAINLLAKISFTDSDTKASFCKTDFFNPLKTSENRRISDVFRGYRSETLVENGLNRLF